MTSSTHAPGTTPPRRKPPTQRAGDSRHRQVPRLALSGAHVGAEGLVLEPSRQKLRGTLTAGLFLVAAVIAVAIVLDGLDSHPAVIREAIPGGVPHTLSRFALAPTRFARGAGGRAAVVRSGRKLVLLIEAHGLAPNHRDVYAVWLATSGHPADLVGLVSPPVGSDGTLSSGTLLPRQALASHPQILLTRETTARPTKPGQPILASVLQSR